MVQLFSFFFDLFTCHENMIILEHLIINLTKKLEEYKLYQLVLFQYNSNVRNNVMEFCTLLVFSSH